MKLFHSKKLLNTRKITFKKLHISILFILGASGLIGQVKIGTNPTLIDSNSLLELESKSKGFLFPRMNTVQMNAMNKPPDGMTIYNTDSGNIILRASGKWMNVYSGNYNGNKITEQDLGCVFVHKYCTIGDGTITNPWKSNDSSAGIKDALRHLSPTCRIIYFKPGYYATTGNQEIDFSKYLPNLSNTYWKLAFSGYGIEFQGHGAAIYVNGGASLTGKKPGLLFSWPGTHVFYWKFTGLQFYGNVDTSLVQWGGTSTPGLYLNGCDFDIAADNGYVPTKYLSTPSSACAIKIFEPLESRLHLVGVCAAGSGVVLDVATFCTISGAFSNTIIPNTNTIYPFSYGLNLINCQSNNFTHMDLEIAYNGIKFDQWSIQNTFSAIFVSQCDSNGATFDNSTQATKGKNIILSIRSGPTVNTPTKTMPQKLYTSKSDSTKIKVENYFNF